MATLEKNKIYRARIEGYSSEGLGIARINGQVVFVHRAVRGEECDILVLKVLKNTAFGKVVSVEKPSEHRQEPDCPYYGKCGGCDFRHMDYEEELCAKRQRVQDAITRVGGAAVSVDTIHGAATTERYRNKVQFPVGEGPAIGFYQARTHRVVDVVDCLLQPVDAARIRQAVSEYLTTYSVPAYDEHTGKGLLRHLYVRTNRAGESLCCLLVNGENLPHEAELVEALRQVVPQLRGVVLGVNRKRNNVILGDHYRTLWGEDYLEETLCGHSFRLSVPSFFQINRDQTEVLYGRALDFAGLTGTQTVVDLYCGIGTISLTMAEKAGQVIGVEVVPEAIEDAKENARRNGLAHKTRFECGDASQLAFQLEKEGVCPDVVVVDPPRKGLAGDVVETIARMAPQRVVYVSCDPATMGRDVKRFAALGYVARRAEAVDLFPRTAHVETVALLTREKSVKSYAYVNISPSELGMGGKVKKPTYKQIQEYVLKNHGLKVSSLYIANLKDELGLDKQFSYEEAEMSAEKRPKCPPEKREAILDAFRHFGMID